MSVQVLNHVVPLEALVEHYIKTAVTPHPVIALEYLCDPGKGKVMITASVDIPVEPKGDEPDPNN